MKRRNYTGLKWSELTEEEKKFMLKEVTSVDVTTGNPVNLKKDGVVECIIDLKHPYFVLGKIKLENDIEETIIDDDAVIYNPTDIVPVWTIESEQLIEIGMTVRFGELFDGDSDDVDELLEDGTVSADNENVVEFEIVERDDNWLDTLVKVTDIY